MYFITTIQFKNNKLEDSRCVGYFKAFEEAEHIVINNIGDIEETIYNYCVIENIPEGIYKYDQNAKWYKFNDLDEVYEPCEIPEKLDKYVGFALG